MKKPWYACRTNYLGLLIVLGGIAEAILSMPAEASIGTIISGVLVILARKLTSLPEGK